MSLNDVNQSPESLIEQIDQSIRTVGHCNVPSHSFFYVFLKTPNGKDKLQRYCYSNKIEHVFYPKKDYVQFTWNTKNGRILKAGYEEWQKEQKETPYTREILTELAKISKYIRR